MRINFKQQELIDSLLKALKKNFSDVKFVDITESPENPDDLWIRVTDPEDDEKQLRLIKYFSRKTTDILMDYGYHILVMPIV